MTQVDKLRIYFILSSDDAEENESSSDMKLASQMVDKYGGYIDWMKPSDCINHIPQDKDVFVFDKFEGVAFDKLKKSASKYVVLGARCLLTCLTSGRCIPPNPHPVFTEGMRDLWITCSGFDQATKKQIQEKVQYMSGRFDSSLRSIITHLVAHNNISSKAIHAYKSNIKIMKISWIEDVWQQSLINNVNGNDEIFDQHISPLFNNLSITTSGISKREKDKLREKIESHGGRFMGTLEGGVTNIVLLTKPEGEKYKFAKAWNILCVKPSWIYDCINAKAILSFKEYTIDSDKPKSSTPNRDNCTINFSANFTTNLSAINNFTNETKQITHLEETAATQAGRSEFQTPRLEASRAFTKADKTSKSAHFNVINNVLLKNLRDAEQFLDGLNIYLYGFLPEEVEKLKQILNKGGAVRFNEMSESVTHVIAGKKDDEILAGLAKSGAYVVSIDWLVESMKLKSRANESKFLLANCTPNSSEPPSPMSKQGAQLLSQNEGKALQKLSFTLSDKNDNEKLSQIGELLCRYNSSQPGEPLDVPEVPPLSNSAVSAANSSTSKRENCSSDDFFSGLSFFLSNDLFEEEIKYLEDLITERKGKIVGKRYLGVPDYAVVPVIGASLQEVTAKEVVNAYFIKDCCIENGLLTPRYYHQPVACVKDATPLKDCVVSVSNYVQAERDFVESLIEALGGIAQSLLARKPKQGALKSTHLVCAEPQGQKFEGALRWGLPVVHHDWLLKCAALGTRVSERPYLIGESKMPNENKPSAEVTKTTINANVTDTSNKMPPEKATPPPESRHISEIENFASRVNPTHNAIARIKATETPKSNSPDPNRTITPTSPYGAFYGKGNPTPGTRKRIWKWMNQGAEFPQDPPSRPFEPADDSTPISQLISRHLEMLKRKPEELPPDSPIGVPFKRLNLNEKENEEGNDVALGLEKMKQIEENFTKNGLKSPPSNKCQKSGAEGRQMVVISESQPHTEVGWEDPAEKEVALDNLQKAVLAPPKVFMFSCIGNQLEESKVLVEECGGIISSHPYFDKKATHLIAGNLTRAEKLMGSIAAGLWVLHPSYLEALKKAKSVSAVSEEDYEWGSPKQEFRLNLQSSNAKDFAQCSHNWRISRQKGHPPPFKGMKILLHLSGSKYDSFKRLIDAGGGKVVVGQPPNYPDISADLCICEPNTTEPVNFASLANQNVRCVTLFFISDVLLKKPNALEKNLVPEFLQFWEKK